MKKILTLLFLFSLILPAAFAGNYQHQKDTTGYRGVAVIDTGIMINGKTHVDNANKQHVLYSKAKQWVSKNYQKIVYVPTEGQERIIVECDEYSLSIRFRDGVISFTFKDFVQNKDLQRREQQVVDNLVQYVRICRLENPQW